MKNNLQFLRNIRSFSAFMYDFIMTFFAWGLSFIFRFNFEIPENFYIHLTQTVFLVVLIQMTVFVFLGLYQGVWQFASIPDMTRIFKAVLIASVAVAATLIMVAFSVVVPRTVLVLDPILLIVFMGGGRFVYRAWKEHQLYGAIHTQGEPVIIIGAGDLAVALLKDLGRSERWRVVGFVDESIDMQGRLFMGVRVLGKMEDLPALAIGYGVSNIIIALPPGEHVLRRKSVTIANENGITSLIAPALDDLISGKVAISNIHKVEVEDLLGREAVSLDSQGLQELVGNSTVMVSGAGGSIGSELCRQVLKYKPKCLVCFDVSEYALYNLEQEISKKIGECVLIFVTGDVKNESRVQHLLATYSPKIVFHAAAYKHVPMMETNNVAEALANNVKGTYVIAHASRQAGVQKFVLVSTDKAVNPTNVMGASKRLAEMVCQGLQEDGGTRFIIVRFGNVLGSSGSVIPKFREQIAKGGPVTVTHPEITRYFMSIPEAAQLVMQAGLMGAGGEIFVLDMGEPVKIVDLAKDMIRLSGLHHDEIKIEFTGLRPGEKLYEELLADDESTLPTHHEKLRIAVARSTDMVWVQSLLKWLDVSSNKDEAVLKQDLKMWVEEYSPDMQSVKREAIIANHVPTIH